MLSRALKMAFWVVHDHLGKLMVASFIWATAVALPISLTSPAFATGDPRLIITIALPGLFVGVFCCGPVLGAGIAHLVKVLIETRDGSLSDFWNGTRTYALRALGVGSLAGVVVVLLATSAWFYPSKLSDTLPILGYGIGALCGWGIALVALVLLFAMPALVQRRLGVSATLKLSAALVLANPGLSLGLGIQVLFLTCITALLWPFFFVGYPSVVISLLSATYELLARKYAGGDAAAGSDGQDDYLNRGIRDLFFPWKG